MKTIPAAVLSSLAVLTGGLFGIGTEIRWANRDGGIVQQPANWRPLIVPDLKDVAVFRLESISPYLVESEGDIRVRGLHVLHDRLTLNLAGSSLEISGRLDVSRGSLRLTGAKAEAESVTAGSVEGEEGILELSDSRLAVSSIRIAHVDTSAGEMRLRGGSELLLFQPETPKPEAGGGPGATGWLRIEEGSRVVVDGAATLRMGWAGHSQGTVLVDGPGSILRGDELSIAVGGNPPSYRYAGPGAVEVVPGSSGGEGHLAVRNGGSVVTGRELFLWETGRLWIAGGRLEAGFLGISAVEGAEIRVGLEPDGSAPIRVNGDVALGQGAKLTVSLPEDFSAAAGDRFLLLDYGGTLLGHFAGLHEGEKIRIGRYWFEMSYLSGSVSATVVSVISGVTYAEWIAGYDLGELERHPGAAPGGDGLANAMKYALGLDPSIPQQEALSRVWVRTLDEHGRLSFDITRNPAAVDVFLAVEVSSDLVEWMSGPENVVILEDSPGRLRVRDARSAAEFDRRFMRLAVTLSE